MSQEVTVIMIEEHIVRLLYKKSSEHDRLYKKNYRPITLQQVDYKILYKMLANRVGKVIHKIIPFNQHAFVKGRLISDPILLIKALIQKAKSDKKKWEKIGRQRNFC